VAQNRYLYNGKELQDQAIGGTPLGWYDYGARFYDPQIARFIAIDPLAGILRDVTPYGYAYNNPVNFIGKEGNGPKTTSTDPKSILFGPKIDMKKAPGGSPRNAAGLQRNGPWFWKQMLQEHPELLSERNVMLIKRNISPECDAEWIERNPSQAAYKGQELVHHHVDQVDMAVGIPEGAHKKLSRELHPYTRGAMRGLGGTLNILAIGAVIFDLFSDNPHSISSMLESEKTGKLYFDNDSQNYYQISSRKDNYDNNGKLVSADIRVDVYSSYSYDKEQGKCVGVDKIGTSTSTVYYGKAAKKCLFNCKEVHYEC